MVKKSTILFVADTFIAVVAFALGFYVLGYNEGHTAGYRSGYRNGLSSAFLQSGAKVTLSPGKTMLVSSYSLNGNNVTIVYSFTLPVSFFRNLSVNKNVQTAGAMTTRVFSTGYVNDASGQVYVGAPDYEIVQVEFKANTTNTASTNLEFTFDLLITVDG
ncbi:hypothetical protein Thermo_00650 [Thermoplasmatales archaeon]|nr:hypothetical protein Thermo_00650 [Thermoplasmatales archaeon]